MKYLFISLIASILFFGCSKKSGNTQLNQKNRFTVDTSDISTKPVSDPDETFNISYKFENGKQLQYRLSSSTHDERILKADSTVTQKMDRSLVYIINTSQANEEKDGTKVMNCEITSVKMEQNLNGKEEKFESGSKMDSAQIIKYTEFYALLNNPFGVRVGPNGGVTEIFKVDKIIDKYLSVRKTKTALTSEQRDRLKEGLTRGILKPIMVQIFRKMPESSVAKDSTWNVQQPPAQYLVFKVNNADSYKVSSLGSYNNDKMAVITAGLKSDIEGKTNLVQNGVTYNFKKPETSTSGKIYFNLSKGYIQKSKINTQLHIFFTMEGMTAKGKAKRSEKESVQTSNVVELL